MVVEKKKQHWNEHRLNKKSFQVFLTPEEAQIVEQAKDRLGVATARELLMTLCRNALKDPEATELQRNGLSEQQGNIHER